MSNLTRHTASIHHLDSNEQSGHNGGYTPSTVHFKMLLVLFIILLTIFLEIMVHGDGVLDGL